MIFMNKRAIAADRKSQIAVLRRLRRARRDTGSDHVSRRHWRGSVACSSGFDQGAERHTRVENAEDAADIASTEKVHDDGRKNRDPTAVEDAIDKGKAASGQKSVENAQTSSASAMPTNIATRASRRPIRSAEIQRGDWRRRCERRHRCPKLDGRDPAQGQWNQPIALLAIFGHNWPNRGMKNIFQRRTPSTASAGRFDLALRSGGGAWLPSSRGKKSLLLPA